MAERTKYLGLSKPNTRDTLWGTLINTNFDILDSKVGEISKAYELLKTAIEQHKTIVLASPIEISDWRI